MMLSVFLFSFVLFKCVSGQNAAVVSNIEETPAFWRSQAKSELRRRLYEPRYESVAKNVILFLGDGMSIPTVTAGRILKGQLAGKPGEETELSFDPYPTTGFVKTYCQNAQVTDSAAAATAFLCGIKTNKGMVGIDGTIKRGECDLQQKAEVTSILDWSIAAGKSVGLITTTSITSATPAAAFANVADRNWEDACPAENIECGCRDIAAQLIDDYPQIQVVMGGGRKYFMRRDQMGPDRVNGTRADRDLIADWKSGQRALKRSYKYIWSLNRLKMVDPATTDSVFGLFASSDMNYDLERAVWQPTLADMTELAIKILSKNPKGFFLLVEGGRIDHAHHAGVAKLALYDLLAFDKAVATGDRLTNQNESLIIVTADHSHTLTFAGYSDRGNDILGKTKEKGKYTDASDGKPYTTLLYGNGLGYVAGPRPDIRNTITNHKYYRQQAAVPLSIETHGGDDVGIWAKGPMAHLLSGTHEQNYIAHVMAYASCVGNYTTDCPKPSNIA